VTHEPVEALSLADRLVVLEGGRVAQEGSVAEVARRPRSSWIAGLVGLNLYRGMAGTGRVELANGQSLLAASPPGPAVADGDDVFAVVRPAAVALHRSRPAGSPRNCWSGTVDSLDVRGDQVRVAVGGALPIVAAVTPAAVAELDLGAGGPIWVAVKASEVDLYPA
jgi:molybdate transport system ATP-binding protein